MEYTLKFPVKLGDGELKTVQLRRPKGKDMRKLGPHLGVMSKGGEGELGGDVMASTLFMVGLLTDQPQEVIDEMDAEDIGGIGEMLTGFFGKDSPAQQSKSTR